MNNLTFNRKIRLEHLENMLAVAIIDGSFEEEEKIYLKDKAEEYGLTSEEVDTVIERTGQWPFSAIQEDFSMFDPKNKYHKEDQLADAVYMSLINGVVAPKEYALCLYLAEKLGMEKRDVDEIIELTIKLWKYDRPYTA